MASSANQQQPFPPVPPSMSAGDSHEMRDYYPPQDAPRPTINQTPNFKPYLGLRARLSQIWINRWTILLLLILVRLLIAVASTDSSLVSARREALSACTQVEKIGSSIASMPHYMSSGLNEMTASGVEKAVSGLMTMLEMTVTGVEEIVLFVIHMMTSTYLCLITLAVSGSLHAAVEISEAVTKKLNETINSVTEDMGDAVKSVSDGINSIMDKINFNIPGFDKPTINLDEQITQLKALELPPDMTEGLKKLNQSIPTFTEVQNFTDNIIRTPFEEVKKLIKGMNTFEFNRSVLPVPQKEALTFCSDGNSIGNFFDDLIVLAYNARKIALGVLIVAAVLVCAPMAWMEMRRYRKMQERAALFAEGHEGMDVVYLASRPTSSGIGLWFGRRFGSARRQAVMRWAWAYATSVPMLFLLSLGLAGLLSCFGQYLLLKAIEDKTPELTDQVADFAGKVVSSLNNASMAWSNADPSGKAKDEITESVERVIAKLMSGIQTEALISSALVLVWLLTAIGGLVYASTHLFRRDYSETGRNPYAVNPAMDHESKIAADYPTTAPPQYVPNDYNVNKAAPYTLAPRPFSTFDQESRVEPTTEKVGRVGAHAVTESSRPGHLRTSSHGQLADPSPADDRAGPFSNQYAPSPYPQEKQQQNPFI
ncbi:hypothetical protein J3E72DRAFT_182781 [Bipolaris maydis]|nr:hypothetical protein J3E74DRAFT_203182 [Bipolaris maydis]KAJ6200844.1 hypothetical protein J3E72DRAFT_182781 [Bipolaris maydis]